MKMKVFLNYADEDKALAQELAEDLTDAGFKVWFEDWGLLPGDNFALKIGRALEEAEAMVVLVSPSSAKSPWVRKALSFAVGSPRYENRVIPVVIRPTSRMPWVIRKFKAIKLGDRKAKLGKVIARMLASGGDAHDN